MNVLEEKSLVVRGIPIKITIYKDPKEFVPIYKVDVPELGEATRILIERVKRDLAEEAKFTPEELLDPKKSKYVLETFLEHAKEKIEEYLLVKDEETKRILAGYLVLDMLGLGKIDILLEDEDLEEIAINSSKEPIWVYHKKFGWLKTNLIIPSEEQIYYYAQEIGRRVGRQIDNLHPLMDAHLYTGDRVNATLFPISTCGNTITIRKFRRNPFTIIDLINFNSVDPEISAFAWLCIQYELNALIAGGTGSGKCVARGTKILTEDGWVEIEKFVEEELKRGYFRIDDGFGAITNKYVYAFDPRDFKIKKVRILAVWKRKAPRKMIKIINEFGDEIIVTPEHPFFTIRDGKLVKVRADEIKEGMLIVFPRRISFKKEVRIPYERLEEGYIKLDENERKYLRENKRRIKREFNLKRGVIEEWIRGKNKIPVRIYKRIFGKIKNEIWTRFKKVKLPSLSEELAEWIGYVIGDGHVDKNYVEFINKDENLLKRFNELTKKLFGVEGKIEYPKNRTPRVRVMSKIIAEICEKVYGIPRGKKARIVRVPEFIKYADEDIIKAFLKALFKCDAHNAKNYIEYVSMSKKLIEDVRFLLLRLGILSTKINDNRLYIPKKKIIKYLVEDFIRRLKEKGLLDRKIAQMIGVSRRYVGKLKYGERCLSEAILRKSVQFFPEIYRKLIEGDVILVKVEKVEEVEYNDEWVYDLSTETETFIANNFVIHNTTFLNCILCYIPPNQRIISIEDTRELNLPSFLHWVPLTTRNPNPEGKGEVTMLDLLVNSLRMRPDRIVVGEVRRKEEAEVMFEAMRTGHSVYATLHANTAEHAVTRLTSPPIELHPEVLEALHIMFVLFRHRRKGIRRVLQVAEIIPAGREGVKVNIVYRWRPATDTFALASEPRRVFAELELFTGMTPMEIREDIEEKKKVLEWMRRHNVNGVENVGKIFAEYYTNKDYLMEFVNNDKSPWGEIL